MHKSRYISRTPPIKRIFDLVISSIALILLSPVMILISIAILLTDGFPILFTQPRPGFKGKVFNNYKFRTMRTATIEKETCCQKRNDCSPGKLLRRISLDELPNVQYFSRRNEFGRPAPLLVEYLPLLSQQQARAMKFCPD